MVEEGIDALMRTIPTVKHADGKMRRVQFLGGNGLDDPDRPSGVLTYSFDKRLIELLKNSTIWGKIAIPVLMAFTSKYSVSLYENVAQVANLTHKQFADYSLDQFREIIGVQPGKYKTFGELNKHVLKPMLMEVNALAPFGVSMLPVKQGKKVVSIKVGWWKKDAESMNEAWRELQRPKVGRKARITGTVEYLLPPSPSIERLRRKASLPKPS